MASPVNDSYSVGSGETLRAGRYSLPAWLTARLADMSAGDWLDVSAETNIATISDDTAPDGLTAWLETTTNLSMTNWPGKATHDRASGVVSMIGCTNGYSSESPAGVHHAEFYFDLATGLFSKQWNPLGVNISHVYDMNGSRPLNGYVYRRPFNNNNLYRRAAGGTTWASYADLSSLSLSTVSAMDVFPTLGDEGSIIFAGSGKVSRLDIATGDKTTLATGLSQATGLHLVCSYHPGADCVIVGGGETGSSYLHKVDNAGTVTQLTSSLPASVPGIGPHNTLNVLLLPDPAERPIAHLIDVDTTGTHYTLDLDDGSWTLVGDTPAGMDTRTNVCGGALTGASALIFFDGRGRDAGASLAKVWLHKVS